MALDPVKNFGKVEASIGYDAAATSIVLVASDGAKLPDPSTDGAFNLTWWNWSDYKDPSDDPNKEIVRVTARTTDTLTVTRAQEGTSASTKNTASKVYKLILAPTKKLVDDINQFGVGFKQGADIASAATTDLGAATGAYVTVTGTTTITGLGTIAAGITRIVKFSGALILTHNATSLILPTAANITTVANDRAEFVSLGSGNWICVNYQRADGTALAASAGTPAVKFATIFETSGRFDQAVTGAGVITFNSGGMRQNTTAAAGSCKTAVTTGSGGGGGDVETASPLWTGKVHLVTKGTDADVFLGIGDPTIASAGITFTAIHIGFKITWTGSGTASLYATQADGATENASAALTTVASNDTLELIFKVNSTTSVDYYWRKNGGALSSATNLTSNMFSTGAASSVFGLSNRNTSSQTQMQYQCMSYER